MSFLIAFIAGILAFFSPCVLPLIPAYIFYVSGITTKDLAKEKKGWRILPNLVLFVLGFSLIFVFLGAGASLIGRFLVSQLGIMEKIAGVIIILFGFYILVFPKADFWSKAKKVKFKSHPLSLFSSFLVGVAFSVSWTPCVGPILASILAVAALSETLTQGMVLLFTFSLGLGLPFLILGLGLDFSLHYIMPKLSKYSKIITLTSGVFLIVLGLLIFLGYFKWLTGNLIRLGS